MTENPYTAPQSSPEPITAPGIQPAFELASRWARLGASLIDSLIVCVVFFPLLLLIVSLSFIPGMRDSGSFLANIELISTSLVGKVVAAIMGIGIYLLIHGYMLVKSGQSIGKKALGIQIVDYNTQQLLPPGRVLGMRYVITSLIAQLPVIGQFWGLIDALFIFGNEKRCLHDLMANSSVIKK